jgi:hypothetical protein
MALGIVTSKIRRNAGTGVTTIDGLPVVLKAGKVLFVDGTRASTGAGDNFASAKTTIQAAVDAASFDDTILIRALAPGSYYTESVVVPPTTKRGLSIVGTGNGKGGSVYQAVTWRNSSNSVDDSALTARSAHMHIENVHFFSRAAQELGFAIKAYWNTGSGLNIGSSINNCNFSADLADHPAAAGLVQSAVRFDSNEGMSVENSLFVDCRVGIASGSTMNAWKELLVRNNVFNGLAANIAADMFFTDGTNASIISNVFGHTVPSHAAGTMTKYIFVAGGATVTGHAMGNYFGSANAGFGTDNTASSFIRSGNFYAGGLMTS